MTHPPRFADDDPVLARLREVALAYPEAQERVSHGRPNFFTTKVFAYFGGSRRIRVGEHEVHDRALLFKPDPAERLSFDDDPRMFVPAYVGPFGWLGVDLPGAGGASGNDAIAWDEVTELVDASYRVTAPRRLVRLLDL